MSGLKNQLIHIPEFLSIPETKSQQPQTAVCNVCEHENQCGWCETLCQNCMGTICLSVCQTAAEGGCANNCDSSCQICQRCEGATCQVCQNCEGASCQSCQCSGQNNQGSVPAIGKISFGTVTDTSIKVNLAAIPSATSYNLAWHEAGGASIFEDKCALSLTFSGLKPDTEYCFGYYGVNGYGTGQYATASKSTLKSRPKDWTWESSNGDAKSAQTKAAYNAVTNHGPLSDFSFKVWNDFCNKINETAVAAKGHWETRNGEYLTLDDTLMSESDKALTAARFNSMKVNIGSRVSTGIQDVSIGDVVQGSYFVTLAEKLNEWIESF